MANLRDAIAKWNLIVSNLQLENCLQNAKSSTQNRYSTTVFHRNQDNSPSYHIKCKTWHVKWFLRLVSQSTQIFQNSIENPKAFRQDRRISATSPPNCRNCGKASREKATSRPRTESSKMPHARLLSCGCFSCQFAAAEKSLDRPIKERRERHKISENPSRKIVGAVVSLDYRHAERRRSPGQPRETVTAPIKFSI